MRQRRDSYSYSVNGKWLAQSPSGTQRYASQVMESLSRTEHASQVQVILPADAVAPVWISQFPTVRSRLRGMLFEQIALPWLSRGTHLFSMAGPAPIVKRDQTVVMHDAMPFRYPRTFRRAFVAWYWLMYGLLSRVAARVLTVSEFSRTELAEVLRVSPERFALAPCAPSRLEGDGDAVYTPPFEAGTFALIVGNLAPHKNVAPAAMALAQAGIQVAVVGMEQAIFRQVDISDSANLRMLGRVGDGELQQLYRTAGVLVAPSRYEGFAIPIVEAGAEGTPAVFALGSAMTEVAGAAGIGFAPDDLDACVDAVRDVLADKAARDDLGRRARTNAARFSWDDTARIIFGRVPARQRRPLRVLHVTETFSAGTGTAVVEYAHAVRRDGVESYLLAQDRGSGLLEELGADSPFVTSSIIEPGLFKLWKALPAAVAQVRPDVVHLHSSLAGAVGRLQPLMPGNPRIAYSPHCFAFERRDIPAIKRMAYRFAEWVLARRTDAFIGVSPHEADLARSLRPSTDIGYVLNSFAGNRALASATIPAQPAPTVTTEDAISVVTLGRVAPQKSPELFADIVTAFPDRLRATWVGDGPDGARSVLERAGVGVTGWLPAADVPEAITGHTVYLHTAGWEASVPIAVLDAVNAGLPVAVRRNAAYRGILPDEWQFDEPGEAIDLIRTLARPDVRARRVAEQYTMIGQMVERSPDLVLADRYRRIAGTGRTGVL
ncbi:glycosyltransferase [Mycobacterium sp. C31M]